MYIAEIMLPVYYYSGNLIRNGDWLTHSVQIGSSTTSYQLVIKAFTALLRNKLAACGTKENFYGY